MSHFNSVDVLWPFWIGGAVLTVVFYGLMIRAGRRQRFLTDTPTSKAKGVFIGQVELAGKAALNPPLRSWLAGAECVWYSFTISEEWGRWETETFTDKDGKSQTRQVYVTGWTQIDAGGETPPFFIQDETGAVLVRPTQASVEPVGIFSETVGFGQAFYHEKTNQGPIIDSLGRRSFTERAIPLGADLFIVGHARERKDVVAPEIAADPTQEMFLISCKGEARVRSGYRWQFWLFGLLALVGLPVAAGVQLQASIGNPDPLKIAAVALSMALLWLVGWVWMSFNSLVGLRNRTVQGHTLIDVQLKRRAELIPRLVEVVKGLKNYEASVQTEVAALRSQAAATPAGQPGADIAGAAPVLVAVTERYPELKANDAFLALQKELSDTETRIALARDYYNAIATHLNTRLEIIPDRWFAPVAGLRPQLLLVAEGFERAPVKVELTPKDPA